MSAAHAIRVILYAIGFIIFVALYYRVRLYFANLSVTSWWRNPIRNLRVGGKISSLHLIGWAYDVKPVTQETIRSLQDLGFRKVINEKDHIHVQII